MNSKALYAVLLQEGMRPGEDFEAVFVDHGCNYDEASGSMGKPATNLEAGLVC